MESYLKDTGMVGLASAWTITRRRPIFEGYGHDGPGVCLGDGRTKAYLKDTGMTGLASAWAMARRRPEGITSQGGRGDALLRRMLPYLT